MNDNAHSGPVLEFTSPDTVVAREEGYDRLTEKKDDCIVLIESRPISPESRILIDYDPLDSGEVQKKEKIILDPYDLQSVNISKRLTPEQRYWYYVTKGIPEDAIAPIDQTTLKNVEKYIPDKFCASDHLQAKRQEMVIEICEDYNIALKQSIVDYILLDDNERKRLMIPKFVRPYVPRIARAPVPWHGDLVRTKAFIADNFFLTNPVMLELLKIFSNIEKARLVDMGVFTPSVLPMTIEDFQSILRSQCQAFKAKLLTE
ncbi:Dynein heavy chain 3, axonemal [Phlyctochytrium bullatum]|nr:Dynein heavy chain 3, axonemal [Phlyctochytrium bullatum]